MGDSTIRASLFDHGNQRETCIERLNSEKPVAKSWFEAREMSNDIIRFMEIHADPYAVGDFWLLRGGETDLVIDTGSGIRSPVPVVEAHSTHPVLAVALNSHYDHAGGWHYFTERACHPLDAEALQDPDEENASVFDYLSDASLSALPSPGYAVADYRMTGAAPTRLLADGEIIDLGGRRVEALHVPGRSPGGLAIWEGATGSLFTSDMLYNGAHGPAWPPPEPAAYVASLERFRALPVETVYPGHYGPFSRTRMLSLIDEQVAQLQGAA